MDHDLKLKPYSLFNYLQDIAAKSADSLNFGYNFLYPKGYCWFLIKYRMEFNNYPTNVEKLTLSTEPRGINKLFAYRDFTLKNEDEILGRVSSVWSIVNMKTRELVAPAAAICGNENMPPFEKREDDLSFLKIRFQKADIEKEFEVRYNDLDVNLHANNGNYIVWAFEPLDFDFKSKNKLKSLDLMFKKEAKFGEKIISQIEFRGEKTTVHRLQNDLGEDLCLIECTWL